MRGGRDARLAAEVGRGAKVSNVFALECLLDA